MKFHVVPYYTNQNIVSQVAISVIDLKTPEECTLLQTVFGKINPADRGLFPANVPPAAAFVFTCPWGVYNEFKQHAKNHGLNVPEVSLVRPPAAPALVVISAARGKAVPEVKR